MSLVQRLADTLVLGSLLALWHSRCPEAAEFSGLLPELRERATRPHWFNPCELE